MLALVVTLQLASWQPLPRLETRVGVFELGAAARIGPRATSSRGPHWEKRAEVRPSAVDLGCYFQPEPLGQTPDLAELKAYGGRGLPAYAYAKNNPSSTIDPDGLDYLDFVQSKGDAIQEYGLVSKAYSVAGRDCVGACQVPYAAALAVTAIGALLVADLAIAAVGIRVQVAAAAGGGGAAAIKNCGDNAKTAAELSASRGIRSLERRIAEHEAKIAEFKRNPTVRPGVENQPPAVIQAQQAARVRHMEREIRAFQDGISKLKGKQ